MASVKHTTIPAAHGAIPISVHLPDKLVRRTIVLHFQGGGFMYHFEAQNEGLCARLAETCGCAIASVGYRLAPQHPFPAATDDAFAAMQWASTMTQDLVICGESAGGALAAAATLFARTRGGPTISQQWLIYPMLAGGFETESRKNAVDVQLMANIRAGWAAYTGGTVTMTDSMAAPLHATDLTRLPPALVIVGEDDPLRDEGVIYAERLRRASVAVDLHRFAAAPHGFLTSSKTVPLRDAALELIRKRLS
jgi:acetyl esterase